MLENRLSVISVLGVYWLVKSCEPAHKTYLEKDGKKLDIFKTIGLIFSYFFVIKNFFFEWNECACFCLRAAGLTLRCVLAGHCGCFGSTALFPCKEECNVASICGPR